MNENENFVDEAVRAITKGAMESAAMAATMARAMGADLDNVDMVHRIMTCIMSNLMHANGRKSVKVTIEFLNDEDMRTEVHYDYLDDSAGDGHDRLDPFKRFFDEKGL